MATWFPIKLRARVILLPWQTLHLIIHPIEFDETCHAREKTQDFCPRAVVPGDVLLLGSFFNWTACCLQHTFVLS